MCGGVERDQMVIEPGLQHEERDHKGQTGPRFDVHVNYDLHLQKFGLDLLPFQDTSTADVLVGESEASGLVSCILKVGAADLAEARQTSEVKNAPLADDLAVVAVDIGVETVAALAAHAASVTL